ncbi:MAG: hypothetical protein ABWZ98_16405 [Nakamurella sp.]
MKMHHRAGRLPGAVRATIVVGTAIALIGSGTAVAFADTNQTAGTPTISTLALPAVGPDGQPIDPADVPTPGEGPRYLTSTIDEDGNVTTSDGTGPLPVPDGAIASGTVAVGGPIAGAQAALMKFVEVGAGASITESFTAPQQAPKLGEVQPAPDGLEVSSVVTGAGTAEDPQVITLTITNTTDGAVSGPVGVSFVQ